MSDVSFNQSVTFSDNGEYLFINTIRTSRGYVSLGSDYNERFAIGLDRAEITKFIETLNDVFDTGNNTLFESEFFENFSINRVGEDEIHFVRGHNWLGAIKSEANVHEIGYVLKSLDIFAKEQAV